MSPAPAIRRLGDDFRWPGGRCVAVVFNLAYEAWSEGHAPGIGPMGNVLKPGFFDTNAHSWASFGAVRGIDRLLDVAARSGVKTSVMVNGVLAAQRPDSVRRIHAAGHEIVAHSWGMDVIPVYLDESEERANLRRTVEAIASVTGERPLGWISPRGTGSLATPRLLAEEGFQWHGDCNDDDLPYVQRFGDRSIAGIALTMDVNDLPWCIRYGNAPGDLLQVFEQTLDAALTHERRAVFIDATAHTHVFGRLAGAWVFAEMMKIAKAHKKDVWIATRGMIAAEALAALTGDAR
jgi:peptidoglycan/xylan/chitin deacetylase (PgdA/CDA1 family)